MKKTDYIASGGLRAEFVQMTKEMANNWLGNLPPNQRQRKPQKVKMLVRDIKAGNWRETGEPFLFDELGQMTSGQHRCAAFLAAGFFPVVLVVRGSQGRPDDVAARTLSDDFKFEGVANYVKVSSVARRYAMDDLGMGEGETPSHQESLEAYFKHREIIEWSLRKWGELDYLLRAVNRAYVVGRMREIWGEAATEKFFSGLASGICDTTTGTLRKRLIIEANKGRGRMTSREELALLIKAANASAEGRALKVLKWCVGEPFPRIAKATDRTA